MLKKEKQAEIIEALKLRIEQLNIKYGSQRFYQEQAAYIAGVAIAVGADNVPAGWYVYVMSGRELYDRDKKEF